LGGEKLPGGLRSKSGGEGSAGADPKPVLVQTLRPTMEPFKPFKPSDSGHLQWH